MGVSYKLLFKLLIDKEIDTVKMVKDGVLSRSTMLKIKKGEYVSLEVLEKVCKYLTCTLNDIVQFTETQSTDNNHYDDIELDLNS